MKNKISPRSESLSPSIDTALSVGQPNVVEPKLLLYRMMVLIRQMQRMLNTPLHITPEPSASLRFFNEDDSKSGQQQRQGHTSPR